MTPSEPVALVRGKHIDVTWQDPSWPNGFGLLILTLDQAKALRDSLSQHIEVMEWNEVEDIAQG